MCFTCCTKVCTYGHLPQINKKGAFKMFLFLFTKRKCMKSIYLLIICLFHILLRIYDEIWQYIVYFDKVIFILCLPKETFYGNEKKYFVQRKEIIYPKQARKIIYYFYKGGTIILFTFIYPKQARKIIYYFYKGGTIILFTSIFILYVYLFYNYVDLNIRKRNDAIFVCMY